MIGPPNGTRAYRSPRPMVPTDIIARLADQPLPAGLQVTSEVSAESVRRTSQVDVYAAGFGIADIRLPLMEIISDRNRNEILLRNVGTGYVHLGLPKRTSIIAQEEDMKLIIFGATGGTGRQCVDQALAQGHQVTAFVRQPAALTVQHPDLTIIQGDITDQDAVQRAIPGHDVVISALGTRGGPAVLPEGTRNILEAMASTACGARSGSARSGPATACSRWAGCRKP